MNAPRFIGASRNHAMFVSRGRSVVVNTKNLTASVLNIAAKDTAPEALDSTKPVDPVWTEIAQAALFKAESPKDISLASSSKRTYTVPKRVCETAGNCLASGAPLTATAKHVATLLSSGEQLALEDVLWVSRFFDHTAEELTDRPIWLAWGGNEGKRWSQGLASRLDYDSVVADAGAYETPGVQAFVDGDESDRTFWALLDKPAPNGQHATQLFKLTEAGTWQAWGNGDWIDADAPEFSDKFVELDDEAALYVAGALFDAPDCGVDLRTPNPQAWDLAQAAYANVDWTLADRAVRADAGPTSPPAADYTPEERAANADSQVRDGNGRFAKVGDAGAIKSSGIGGTVTAIDYATKSVTVQGEDGQTYQIPADDFEVGAAPHPKVDPDIAKEDGPNFAGIIAPEVEEPSPRARMSHDGEILNPVRINEGLDSYSQKITEARQVNAEAFRKLLDHEDAPKENYEHVTDHLRAAGEMAPAEGDGATPETDVPPPSADPTPDATDVEPVYLAIVDREDPRAVMELVALVPASATSSEPKTFRRSGGKWVEDPKILQDMRSATPPPIVQLNADEYVEVVGQVDMEVSMPDTTDPAEAEQGITAAGGADRNNGNAEELREYWTVGAGGLKIRWGTGGDWTRCVRLLSKHLGPRAKGYCALRHKEMTGMWPGDRANKELSSPALVAGGAPVFTTDLLKQEAAVIKASADIAAFESAIMRVRNGEFTPIPQDPQAITEGREGRAFRIPLAIPEGIATGDGRIFGKGALGIRTLPLPLMWQIKTGEGHDGSVLVGRIDRIERTEAGLGNAIGVFDIGPYGQEAQRLVESQMLRWVSADLDKFEIDEELSDEETGKMHIKKGRFMGATIVPKPAFQECTIELEPLEEPDMTADAVPSAISASAAIANAIPVEPPSTWFERPVLNGPTPITVMDDGQVFGHIATWQTSHIGMAGQINPPRSASGYAYFHTGVVRTSEGKDVRVGQLTLAGGHAPIEHNAQLAVKHYDDTASAIADVHAGEDAFGIWVAGALRPGTTPEQIRSLRASAPSGDWRSINHRLELVAVCQVNVPGFPVPRSMVASGGGAPMALVAAGTADLLQMRIQETPEDREAIVASAKNRMWEALRVDEYLADGTFGIKSPVDLHKAVLAYEKVPSHKQAFTRRHIVRHARSMNRLDLIPKTWNEVNLSDESLDKRDRYDSLVAAAHQRKVEALRARVAKPLSSDDLNAQLAALKNRIQK